MSRGARLEGADPAAPALPVDSELARDVALGLASTPKTLPPKYFYDELGSTLFDAICRLPWYRITRAELALLTREAARILGAIPEPRTLVELGPGSGEKLAALLGSAGPRLARGRVHLVDISQAALEVACRTLGELPGIEVVPHRATFEEGLAHSAAGRAEGERRMVLFLGSNIGNLDAAGSARFLAAIRRTLAPGDALLLGADLVKQESELLLAYDDPLGVTAAFNRNLLVRMNRELGADFDLSLFSHRALWNAAASRVEMHLVARIAHRVNVPGAGLVASFEAGESIFTESSHKYDLGALTALVTRAGFAREECWEDAAALYALLLFRAV